MELLRIFWRWLNPWYRLVKAYPCPVNDFYWILEIEYRGRIRKWRGNGTVWDKFPSLRSEHGFGMESMLYDFWKKAEYDWKARGKPKIDGENHGNSTERHWE